MEEQQNQSENGTYKHSGILCNACSKRRSHWRLILVCSLMIAFLIYVLCGLFFKSAFKERIEFFIGVGVVLIIIPLTTFTVYGVVKFLRKGEKPVIPWNLQQQPTYSGEISPASDSTQEESNRENKINNNNRTAHDYYDSIPTPEISKQRSRGSKKESGHHSRKFEAETSEMGNFHYPPSAQYSPEKHRQRNVFTRSSSNATRFRYDFDNGEQNERMLETCPKGGVENGRYALDIERHPKMNAQESSKESNRHLRSKSENTDVIRKDIAGDYLKMEYSENGQENYRNRQPPQRRSRSRSESKECSSRRKAEEDFSPNVPTSFVPRNFARKVQYASQSGQPTNQPLLLNKRSTRNSLSNTEIIKYLSPDLENTENEKIPRASSRRQENEYIPTREMEHPSSNKRISEYNQKNNRTLGELGNQNHMSRDDVMSYPSTNRETLGYESAYSSDTVIGSSGYGTEDNRYEEVSMRQCPPPRSAEGLHLRPRSNKYVNDRQSRNCSARNGDYRNEEVSMRQCPPTRSAEGLHLRLRSNKYVNGRQSRNCSARNSDYRTTDSELQGREYHQRMLEKTRLISGFPSTNTGHSIVQPMLENIKALNYPFYGYLPQQHTLVGKENSGKTEDFEHQPKRISQANKVTRTQTSINSLEYSPTNNSSSSVVV